MRRLVLLPMVFLCACGGPSREEIDDAKGRVSAAVAAVDLARKALTLLGILPTYECGEPRRTFVGEAVEDARRDYPCATVSTEAVGETDAVNVVFPDTGCAVKDFEVRGASAFVYSGGEDRFELHADMRELIVDGTKLQTSAGYGKCSDEQRFFASSTGPVPRRSDLTFKFDATVGKRDGIPIIGGTTLVLDGPGEITGASGTDRVTCTGLEYEIGEYLPKSGKLLIETAAGTRIEAAFSTTLWRLGEAEIKINDYDSVTVPIIR